MANNTLISRIRNIERVQHIDIPVLREPGLVRDEFNLFRPRAADNHAQMDVEVSDLVQMLKKTKSGKKLHLSKELRDAERSQIILSKPLEKPVQEKIRRISGYEKTKKTLSRWDPIVTRNRHQDHQVFPLDNDAGINDAPQKQNPRQYRVKSELMEQMDAIESKLSKPKNGDGDTRENDETTHKLMAKEDLIMRRKELAYMKMRESQQSRKAYLRNKIKSKKYHKLMKRDKLNKQINKIESLRKSDPEKALEMMEQIELNRIEERAILRHKNTGVWAKNLKMRAKYDTEARKSLAEQLALSRELTQHAEDMDNSENEEEFTLCKKEEETSTSLNPWIKNTKPCVDSSAEVQNFVAGYRKYWLDRNSNSKEEQQKDSSVDSDNINKNLESSKTNSKVKKKNIKLEKQNICKKKPKSKSRPKGEYIGGWFVEDIADIDPPNEKSILSDQRLPENIDDLFDVAEEIIQQNVEKGLSNLKTISSNGKIVKGKNKPKHKPNTGADLVFKKSVKHPECDEALIELPHKSKEIRLEAPSDNLNDISHRVDPNIFVELKPKVFSIGDNAANMIDQVEVAESGNDNQLQISNAFTDDDIVADFNQEINEAREETKDVDVKLFGWGSWAGCGIAPKSEKRPAVKISKETQRKNENKTNISIKKKAVGDSLKEHLVSELPFPFHTVKDFEASVRAPVGRNFIPETAFRVLTRPEINTKLGKVIEPMDESFLMKDSKAPRQKVKMRRK